MKSVPKQRLTVFSPYSGIWPHSLSEWQLARQLSTDNFEISVINCGGVLKLHCAVMESFRLDIDSDIKRKEKICRSCKNCAGELLLPPYEKQHLLSNYVSEMELDEARKITESLTLKDFATLIVGKTEIGKLTAYETLIKYKKTSLELNHNELNHWKTSVFQGLVVRKSAQRILELDKPELAIIYSPQYAAGSVFAAVAAEMGIGTYFVEGSSNIAERYQALRIWSWERHGLVNPALENDAFRHEPGLEDTTRVKRHFQEIQRAKSFSVYSPKANGSFNPNERFGIKRKQKIVLAALSSYDEAYSAFIIGGFPESKYKGKVFLNQFDWITQTIDWFRNHTDYFLIIRLHPRDFPNKRESVVSEQTAVWSNLLNDLPLNVAIDYPNEKISLQDYFGYLDAFTTGWSSTAIEALHSGIPVVTYDSGMPSYPSSIHFTGDNRELYFQNIEKAISSGRSTTHHSNAISWQAFSFCVGTIRVPGRIFDWCKFKSVPLFGLILRFTAYYFPRFLHRIEISHTLENTLEPDKSRINDMLINRKSSLYNSE